MQIHILENGMIKEQSIETDKSVLMIYGYNNSGKTSLLKTMDQSFDSKNIIFLDVLV